MVFAGEVVCRPCYDKNYSCKAYTLSGADMLKFLDTAIIKGEDTKDACPRCSGKVSDGLNSSFESCMSAFVCFCHRFSMQRKSLSRAGHTTRDAPVARPVPSP